MGSKTHKQATSKCHNFILKNKTSNIELFSQTLYGIKSIKDKKSIMELLIFKK